MDRQSFSNYGAIVIVVVVLAIVMAFAPIFANHVKDDVLGVMNNFNDKAEAAVSGGGSGSGSETPQEPGLYVDGVLTKTWDALVDEGTVEVSGTEITYAENVNGALVIPEGITSIADYALEFAYLTSLYIPSTVVTYDTAAGDLAESYDLTEIVVASDNPSFASIDGILYDKALTELICVPRSISGAVVIPNGISTFDSYAFGGCTGLTSIELPDSLSTIGDYAFSGCTGLTSITIPASVTEIAWDAFSGCTSLTSVVFEDTEGWSASGEVMDAYGEYENRETYQLSSEYLSDPSTAATYLTEHSFTDDTVRQVIWSKS